MKRLVLLSLFVMTFSSFAFADKVKIGIIGPFSGDWALIGDSIREGALLAKEEQKNLKHEYEFIFEDAQIDPLKVATGSQKLIQIDKVDALFSVLELSGQVVSPLAEKYKLPHISLASSKQVAKGDYNFTHYVTIEDQSAAYIGYLKKENLKKVALYWIQAPVMKALRDQFIKDAKMADIEVIEVSYQGTERNFRPLIQSTLTKKPQISLLFDYAPTIDILRQQMLDLKAGRILGTETYINSKNISLFENTNYFGAYGPTDDFIRDFKARYKKTPGIGAGNGYDIIRLYIEVYESFEKKPSSKEVVQRLVAHQPWDGAMGPLTMDKEGVIHSKSVERRIKNGESVLVK